MALIVPGRLVAACKGSADRENWLGRLPVALRRLETEWSLSLGAPFEGDDGTCSWVAPVSLSDGRTAVLKIGMPHMESAQEVDGLRFWDGDPTVKLLESDCGAGAMLIEYCEPGIALRSEPEPEQDVVIARLLRRLWRRPSGFYRFRHLAEMLAHWSAETMARTESWPDSGLVSEGLRLFDELSKPRAADVLLATDLHAGNVLRAQREPWLVIDPKPFIGDPAYDATQHLLNCEQRLLADPEETIKRFADLLQVDRRQVRLWSFARAAAEPRDEWNGGWMLDLARAIAPA